MDGGEFHQVSYLAVKIPLGQILRLRQCLQENRGRGDVLARAKLLWELHAGVVYDVAVDSARADVRSLRDSSLLTRREPAEAGPRVEACAAAEDEDPRRGPARWRVLVRG